MATGGRKGQSTHGGRNDSAGTGSRAAGKPCGMPRPLSFLRFAAPANDNRPAGRRLIAALVVSALTVALGLAGVAVLR